VSPLVANLLKVGVVVALVVLLYVIVSGVIRAPAGGPSMDFTLAPDNTNWSATLTVVPAERLPSGLYLLVRNGSGDIVLPRTSFENLTGARWALNLAVYEDRNPGEPQVQAGDRLLLDRAAYPVGSVVEISDKWAVLTIRTLK